MEPKWMFSAVFDPNGVAIYHEGGVGEGQRTRRGVHQEAEIHQGQILLRVRRTHRTYGVMHRKRATRPTSAHTTFWAIEPNRRRSSATWRRRAKTSRRGWRTTKTTFEMRLCFSSVLYESCMAVCVTHAT